MPLVVNHFMHLIHIIIIYAVVSIYITQVYDHNSKSAGSAFTLTEIILSLGAVHKLDNAEKRLF